MPVASSAQPCLSRGTACESAGRAGAFFGIDLHAASQYQQPGRKYACGDFSGQANNSPHFFATTRDDALWIEINRRVRVLQRGRRVNQAHRHREAAVMHGR